MQMDVVCVQTTGPNFENQLQALGRRGNAREGGAWVKSRRLYGASISIISSAFKSSMGESGGATELPD